MRPVLFREYLFFCVPDVVRERPILTDVADTLQSFWDNGRTGDVLNINMPTRFGKSLLSTFFSSWLLLRDPDTRILRISYAAELSELFSEQVRRAYLDFYSRAGVELPTITGTRARWKIGERTEFAHIGAGVGGGLTGFGADVAIVDDTAKNMQEATSAAYMRQLEDFRTGVLLGRLEGRRKIINVGTRWTLSDWFSLFPDAESVIYPAMTSEGVSICEAWKSTAELEAERARVSSEIWAAQYQQQPTAEGRRRLFADWSPMYIEDDDNNRGECYIVIDPATDYGRDWFTVGFYEYRAGFIILRDMWYEAAASPSAAASWIMRHFYKVAYIEANGVGRSVANKLRAHGVRNLVGFTTSRDKYSRAYIQAEAVANYFRIARDCNPMAVEELTKEARAFPDASGNIHDDVIDNVIMSFERILKI